MNILLKISNIFSFFTETQEIAIFKVAIAQIVIRMDIIWNPVLSLKGGKFVSCAVRRDIYIFNVQSNIAYAVEPKMNLIGE